jgi:hypothetical protein
MDRPSIRLQVETQTWRFLEQKTKRQVVKKQEDWHNTVKKETKIFLIYTEIQKGSAKSYMRKGFLLYMRILRKYLAIYEEAVRHILLFPPEFSDI